MTSNFFFFLLAVGLLLSCEGRNPNQNVQTEKIRINNEPDREGALKNDGFPEFWAKFKTASLGNERKEVATLVHFPFQDNFNDIYDKDHSLSCMTIEEFMEKYDSIFESCVLRAIETNNYRGYDENHGEFGDIIGVDDYLLITKCPARPKDLVFEKIDNQYRLSSIQYYQ